MIARNAATGSSEVLTDVTVAISFIGNGVSEISNNFTAVSCRTDPSAGSTITSVISVAGWTFANVNVATVEILVDGVVDGTASYGSPRPDVAGVYPNAPVNVGFSYSLDTAKYANGPHVLNVRVTDTTGNVGVFSDMGVTVSN